MKNFVTIFVIFSLTSLGAEGKMICKEIANLPTFFIYKCVEGNTVCYVSANGHISCIKPESKK